MTTYNQLDSVPFWNSWLPSVFTIITIIMNEMKRMEWIKCWKLKQRRKAHWGPATSPAACRPAVITLARSPECSHSWIYLLISFSVSCLSVWTDRRIQNNRNVLFFCFCIRGGCWVYLSHFTEADQSEKRRKRHHSEHSCTQTFISLSLSFVRCFTSKFSKISSG